VDHGEDAHTRLCSPMVSSIVSIFLGLAGCPTFAMQALQGNVEGVKLSQCDFVMVEVGVWSEGCLQLNVLNRWGQTDRETADNVQAKLSEFH
jgi:hypothetical protein